MCDMSFSRYAAIVKNLRGVLLFDPSEDVSEVFNWLSKRFKYRNLGLTPELASSGKCLTEGKTFIRLEYPSDSIRAFTKYISEILQVEKYFSEALTLASSYISPIIAVGGVCSEVERFSVDEVKSRVEMGINQWKLHMRIADYSVLDLYSWSVENARRIWEGKNLEEIVDERVKRIREDKKRYWRLSKGDLSPKPFLCYVDSAKYVVDAASKREEVLRRLLKYNVDDVSACLGIEVAILIPNFSGLP